MIKLLHELCPVFSFTKVEYILTFGHGASGLSQPREQHRTAGRFQRSAGRVIGGAREVYKSSDGILSEHAEIIKVTEGLKQLTYGLAIPATVPGTPRLQMRTEL